MQRRPKSLLGKIYRLVLETLIPLYPDRVHLRHVLLPEVAWRTGPYVLYVGCQRYSKDALGLLRSYGKHVATIDDDPNAFRWRHAAPHVTGDIRDAGRFFGQWFDLVIFNGVIGFGIDQEEDIADAFTALHAVLKLSGMLLLGWNPKLADATASLSGLFVVAADFPTSYGGEHHRYLVLRKDFYR